MMGQQVNGGYYERNHLGDCILGCSVEVVSGQSCNITRLLSYYSYHTITITLLPKQSIRLSHYYCGHSVSTWAKHGEATECFATELEKPHQQKKKWPGQSTFGPVPLLHKLDKDR